MVAVPGTHRGRTFIMKNISLEIEYLGTNYFGFQVQGKLSEPTIQSEFEKALKKLFKKDIRIAGSGRTDRGVHARAQVVNFKVETRITLADIKRALNAFLPPDIRVKKIKRVSLDFHSRFSARSKTYRYLIYNRKEPSVFERDFSWHIPKKLDLKAMRKRAKKLVGRKDFSSFAKGAKAYKHCVREVKSINISRKGRFIQIDIKAGGFLRCMARNMASFLTNRGEKPAPAHGLYLLRVEY